MDCFKVVFFVKHEEKTLTLNFIWNDTIVIFEVSVHAYNHVIQNGD